MPQFTTEKQIEHFVARSIRTINNRSDAVVGQLSALQDGLHKAITEEFFNRVDIKAGRIVNNQQTRRAITAINATARRYMSQNGGKLVQEVKQAIDEIVALNRDYFAGQASVSSLDDISKGIRSGLLDMYGLTDRGALIEGGYLSALITDANIGARITRAVVNQTVSRNNSQAAVKEVLKRVISGTEKEGTGIFAQANREVINDLVANTDRMVTEAYADKLKLNFAIYSGSLIDTSRKFCIDHAQKVYHKSEIAKFNPPEAKPPGYNPFTMLGGYNCRHRLSWISDALAVRMRSDAAKFLEKPAA
jgi:hypothetical protein